MRLLSFRIREVGFIFAICVAVLSSCGSSDDATSKSSEAPLSVSSMGLETLNQFVSSSSVAVVGRVVAVSAPRWNSPDGKEWKSDRTDPVSAFQYRVVTVEVSETIYSNEKVGLVGEKMDVLFWGSGSPTDPLNDTEKLETPNNLNLLYSQISGPVSLGEVHVLVAESKPLVRSDGSASDGLWVMSYPGNWTVSADGTAAINVDPLRSVPLDALIRVLRGEHERGRLSGDKLDSVYCTATDILATTCPPRTDPSSTSTAQADTPAATHEIGSLEAEGLSLVARSGRSQDSSIITLSVGSDPHSPSVSLTWTGASLPEPASAAMLVDGGKRLVGLLVAPTTVRSISGSTTEVRSVGSDGEVSVWMVVLPSDASVQVTITLADGATRTLSIAGPVAKD